MTITSKLSQSVHSTMDHGTRSIGAVLGFDYIFPILFPSVFQSRIAIFYHSYIIHARFTIKLNISLLLPFPL
jgi:hypothetical protein